MLSEKVVRIGFGVLVTIWLARYLGPLQFGKLSFAISFVALFGIISTMGLDKFLAKELIASPDQKNLIMGSALTLRVIGGVVLVFFAISIAHIIRPEDKEFILLVMILSSGFIFNSFEVIKYWFESVVDAKYSAIVDASVVLVGSITKVALIMSEAPLIAFGWVVFLESTVLGLGLIIMYRSRGNTFFDWKCSSKTVYRLLKRAFPLVLAGAVFILFTRIDQVMLGSISGDSAVGIYAAAVRLSEGWMFVPALIATSLFPAMIDARAKNHNIYIEQTQHLLNLMVLFSVFVAVFFTFISSPFIRFSFGETYAETSLVLSIHIWGMIFNTISIISFRWFLIQGLEIYSFYRALAGLIINVGLNFLIIPLYGAAGAAFTTVISQIIAAYILNYVSPKTRNMFLMQSKALSLKYSLESILYLRRIK